MKCKYKYRYKNEDLKNKKCPHDALPHSDYCIWHEPEDGKDFSGEDIQGTDLSEAYLAKANLKETKFKKSTDLQFADLERADLFFAKLQKADLQFADLQGADLRIAHLQGTDLSYADLQGADLRIAHLQGTDLSYADLQGANISYSDLTDALFNDKSDLRGAFLYAVEIKNAKGLQYAKISSKYIEEIIADKLDHILNSNGDYKEVLKEVLEPELRKLGLTDKSVKLFITNKYIYISERDLLQNVFKSKKTISKYKEMESELYIYKHAKDVYINLKNYFKNVGLYDESAEFFIGEYRVRGKIFKVRGDLFTYILRERIKHTFQKLAFWKHYEEEDISLQEKKSANLLWDMLMNYFAFLMNRLIYIISSYGESIWKVFYTALLMIFIYAGIYFIKGGIIVQNEAQPIHSFLTSLYFSIVTFTTLGYGDLHPVPSIEMRLLAGSEAFLGAFLLAYFVVVVSRKIMR